MIAANCVDILWSMALMVALIVLVLVFGAAVAHEEVAPNVDDERGGEQTIGAGTLAGIANPGEEVSGGGDPRAGGAVGDAGLDLGGTNVGVEAGHGAARVAQVSVISPERRDAQGILHQWMTYFSW